MYAEKPAKIKMFTNGLELKRQFMKWKHTDSPVKKKFRARRSVKNVMCIVFRNMKGPITINFLEKGPTVNSASYYLLLSLYIYSLYIYIYIYIVS